MKNKLIAAGLVAGIIIGGTFAVGATENDDSTPKNSPSASNVETKSVSNVDQITLEEATEIAKREATGQIEEVEKETEHGRLVYDFEFEDGQNETEVHVDAITGKVTKVEHDRDDDTDDNDDKDDNDDDSDDERI